MGSSYCLSGEALAEDFGVLMDEQVLDGIRIAFPGGRRRERAAVGWMSYPVSCPTNAFKQLVTYRPRRGTDQRDET